MATQRTETVPRILGLTGPIACGKSTVGNILLELGALARIDADEVVHQLLSAGTETSALVASAFGSGVLAGDGAIDRAALGSTVFADPAALRRLESIVHPAVPPAIRRRIASFEGQDGIVILDAVKLLHSELADLCSDIWVVQCAADEEFRRLTEDRGLSPQEASNRIASQPTFVDSRVAVLIDNSGSRAETRARVVHLWTDLTSHHG